MEPRDTTQENINSLFGIGSGHPGQTAETSKQATHCPKSCKQPEGTRIKSDPQLGKSQRGQKHTEHAKRSKPSKSPSKRPSKHPREKTAKPPKQPKRPKQPKMQPEPSDGDNAKDSDQQPLVPPRGRNSQKASIRLRKRSQARPRIRASKAKGGQQIEVQVAVIRARKCPAKGSQDEEGSTKRRRSGGRTQETVQGLTLVERSERADRKRKKAVDKAAKSMLATMKKAGMVVINAHKSAARRVKALQDARAQDSVALCESTM